MKAPTPLTNVVVFVLLIREKDTNADSMELFYFSPIVEKYFHASINTIFEKELLEQFSEAA